MNETISYTIATREYSLVTQTWVETRTVQITTEKRHIVKAAQILQKAYAMAKPGQIEIDGRKYAMTIYTMKNGRLHLTLYFPDNGTAVLFRQALMYHLWYELGVEGSVWVDDGDRSASIWMDVPDLVDYILAGPQ